MRTALCYSGQIGAFNKALNSQKQSFMDDVDDIYAYTSNVVSHKTLNRPQVKDLLSLVKTKKQFIEDESLEDTLNDSNMSKWQWLRKRQLWKMHQCHQMIEGDYDIIIRCRFEFNPFVNIPVKDIYKTQYNSENKIFLFGGWSCVAPMIFMDEMLCDGFAFGSPRVMDIFSSLYLKSEPYPYDPKYKDCWDRFGDNVEYQLREHLEKHGVEIVPIKNTTIHAKKLSKKVARAFIMTFMISG